MSRRCIAVTAAALSVLAARQLQAENIFDVKYAPLATTLPKVAPNWKVEVVTAPPILHWPSVVETAPDGRIFVAEDPMDMPGPGNKPADRILCIHPDGQVTVFADHLYAVFGLRYIDGKLYVHHSPKLSVFTDDNGVGKDRRDIWDTDCIATWGGGNLNDHIPANIRLGMDGFLYMAVGDKGIFGAKSNVDGSVAELHGGGVLRLRPDGSKLEIYSSGTRNHLDVALNAEDEIFTYDNTDDGLGWWTRYTHMVDGGYYGYPHDYRPEDSHIADMEWYRNTSGTLPYRPWTLWRIDETGGGSACGAVGYNEDALPDEYRGNSFNCEWGKGKLQRFHTVRDGGTYKIAKMEDVIIGGPECHPVGITVVPDGTGFYVCDWQMGGWNSKLETGRLLKLTYTGAMHPAAKPAWYVPAAEGQKFDASLADLIAGLSHPAESVRLVAERRVAEHGKEAIAPLLALLNDASAPAFGRWSAIWTLDMIDGGQAARAAILAVARDEKADASVRMQCVRQLGTRAAPEATDVCIALLNDPNAAVRFRAATALGRIGSAAAVTPLIARLDEPDFYAHFSVFKALRRIGQADPKAWPAIVNGLASDKPKVREGLVLALHEVYDKDAAAALAAFAVDAKNAPDARAAAIAALAPMHRQRPAWDGRWWGTQPQRSPEPERTVDYAATPVVLAAISSSLNDPQMTVRLAAIEASQVAPDPAAASVLVQLFGRESDVGVRRAILQALAGAKSPQAMTLVKAIFKDPRAQATFVPDAAAVAEQLAIPEAIDALVTLVNSDAPPEAVEPALASLGRLRAAKAVGAIGKRVASPAAPVAAAACTALGAIGGHDAALALIPAASDSREPVRKAAVVALGATQDAAATPTLLEAWQNPAMRVDAITALTKHPDPKAADAYFDGLGGSDGGLRALCRKAIETVSGAVYPRVEERLQNGPPLPLTAVAELQRIYTRNQPIRDWQVLGAFPIDTPEAVDLGTINDAGHMPTGVIGPDKKPLSWKKATANSEGMIDLSGEFELRDRAYAYAVTTLDSPAERDATVGIGQDDGLVLYVNGEKVYQDLNNHAWSLDASHAAVHLKAGKNIVAVKITQDGGPWAFSISAAGEHPGRLYETDTKSTDVKTYDAYAAGHDGDSAAGSTLFHNAAGLGCVKCHVVSGQGGAVGPDLSSVGTKFNRAQLIESVLYPSKQIESGYEQTMIRTKDGNVQGGVVRGETDAQVTLYDSGANKIVIRKADIQTRKISPISVMPEGLQAGLTHQQFADLIAYLQSLKEAVKK